MVRSLLREPLVHFLVAGALLFGLYAALDRTADDVRTFGSAAPEGVPMTTQDRAYTSPIWYTPEQ